MFKYALLFLFLIPACLGYEPINKVSIDPIRIKLVKQICKNKPNITTSEAVHLADIIEEVSKAYSLEPKHLAAILAQESMYNLKAINKQTRDYGMAQINHKTANLYGFNIARLQRDDRYSIHAAAIVLNGFKRIYGHKEKDYWSRYNSSNPTQRKKYKSLVARYM